MKRTRFMQEQIMGVLKEAEVGAKTADLAWRHGVSEVTIYNSKAKYGGLSLRSFATTLLWSHPSCWKAGSHVTRDKPAA